MIIHLKTDKENAVVDTMTISRPDASPAWDVILADHRKLDIVRRKSVDREEYLDHMTFRANKRVLFHELFGPLPGVKEAWREQGASPEELDFSAFPFVEPLFFDVGAVTGYFGPDQAEVLVDDGRELVFKNHMGIRHRMLRGSSTIALPSEYPVRTREDWLRIRQFYEYVPERLPAGFRERCREQRALGHVIVAAMPGGFDEIRVLMGDEEAIVAPYEQPELVAEILDVIGATAERVIAEIAGDGLLDQLNVHEDMAGKSGPLWGPAQVEEFMVPYYRRVWETARRGGCRLFNVDSDGDCNAIMESLLKGGVNMFHPCEPMANMDIVALRRKFGARLAFEGGIDKYALLAGKDAIARELARVVPFMAASGGCMLGLDHRIPNGVSLENYRFYVKRLMEIISREGGSFHA